MEGESANTLLGYAAAAIAAMWAFMVGLVWTTFNVFKERAHRAETLVDTLLPEVRKLGDTIREHLLSTRGKQ